MARWGWMALGVVALTLALHWMSDDRARTSRDPGPEEASKERSHQNQAKAERSRFPMRRKRAAAPGPTGHVMATVRGEARPLAGAELHFDRSDGRVRDVMRLKRRGTASTDETGRAFVPDVPVGTWTLRVSHPTYAPQEAEVTVAEGSTAAVTISLDPGLTLVGRVLTFDGSVAKGARLRVYRTVGSTRLVEDHATTDERGEFRTRVLAPDETKFLDLVFRFGERWEFTSMLVDDGPLAGVRDVGELRPAGAIGTFRMEDRRRNAKYRLSAYRNVENEDRKIMTHADALWSDGPIVMAGFPIGSRFAFQAFDGTDYLGEERHAVESPAFEVVFRHKDPEPSKETARLVVHAGDGVTDILVTDRDGAVRGGTHSDILKRQRHYGVSLVPGAYRVYAFSKDQVGWQDAVIAAGRTNVTVVPRVSLVKRRVRVMRKGKPVASARLWLSGIHGHVPGMSLVEVGCAGPDGWAEFLLPPDVERWTMSAIDPSGSGGLFRATLETEVLELR